MQTAAPGSRYRVGVDIGGTFTDVVVVDEMSGALHVTKVPTVPLDPSRGFMDGVEQALRQFKLDPAAIGFLVHGTTIATNTVIQGVGARAGLLTSEGFRDVLEIAYQTRPVLYEIFYDKPKPLIPRHRCLGVRERTGPEGEALAPLDEDDVARAARALVAEKVEVIAIAFLHSYKNPAHERRAGEIVRALYPDLPVVLSSDVSPEYREYPRTSTAVVNAVLLPRVGPYIARLEGRIDEAGIRSGLHLMTSSGGIVAASTAKQFPVQLVESGPAAGVIGAAFAAESVTGDARFPHILSLDIGGTTAKAALVDNGKPALADEFEVGVAAMPTTTAGRGQGYPVKMPVISLVEIGAGGGSIAHLDPGGALTVGPESAGADPGPACYGKGGDRPTLTDANLVLGVLNPEYFLGGALRIDPAQAEAAILRDIARPLGLSLHEAARMIIDIANAKMVSALQFVSVQRGIDPRGYALVPSGGAGPMHAAAIAQALGVRTVLVPPTPGLNSALGLLATDIKHEFVRTEFTRTAALDPQRLRGIVEEMAARGRTLLQEEGVGAARIRVVPEAEVCYVGQSYPLRVPIPPEGDPIGPVNAAFHALHKDLYGFSSPQEETMLVNVRVTALGAVDRPALKPLPRGGGDAQRARKAVRRVYFREPAQCAIYDRDRLLAEDTVLGPAIIEQMDTTTLVPPGAAVSVDPAGSLIMTLSR